MNISVFIADLLEEHEYVIIPGLGAFISTYQPARFVDNNKTILPPSRFISFNTEMKINDGLLAGHIAHQQKIPLSQAQKLLDQYTGDLIYQLDHDGKVVVDGLGILTGKESVYQFIPDASAGRNPGSFGLEPVATLITEPEVQQVSGILQKKQGGKKLPSWVGLLKVPMLVFVILLAYFVFFYNKPKTNLPASVKQPDTVSNRQTETKFRNDSVHVLQTKTPVSPADTFPHHSGKELYYIIGGSFRSQQFANEYYEKMTKKGFHPVHLGPVANFWMVALDTFSTEKEAVVAADLFTKLHPGTDLWISHRKRVK